MKDKHPLLVEVFPQNKLVFSRLCESFPLYLFTSCCFSASLVSSLLLLVLTQMSLKPPHPTRVSAWCWFSTSCWCCCHLLFGYQQISLRLIFSRPVLLLRFAIPLCCPSSWILSSPAASVSERAVMVYFLRFFCCFSSLCLSLLHASIVSPDLFFSYPKMLLFSFFFLSICFSLGWNDTYAHI